MNFSAIRNITDNCQLASIANAVNLFRFLEEVEDGNIEDVDDDHITIGKYILNLIKASVYKKMFLLDLTENDFRQYNHYLKDLFESMTTMEYTSTNGSSMVLCVCVLAKFDED